jgi:hypothetical protein
VERFKPGVNPGWRRNGMDKFLLLQRILTEMHSLAKDNTTLETRPAAHPVKIPGDSILTFHPFCSIKKHDRIITDEINTRGIYPQRTLKLMPKKPGNRLERIGEFTCNEAVDILMAIGITGVKLNEVQKRGEYQIKKIKLSPKKSGNRLERVGEFTGNEAVDVLKAIGKTGGKLNETRKQGLRWKRERRYFQKRTADLRV